MGPLFFFLPLPCFRGLLCLLLCLEPGHASRPRFYYILNTPMDTGRLPAYRSSYLLRFHPYPRVKPSVRERIAADTWEHEHYGPLQMNSLHLESDTSFTLGSAIYGTDVQNETQLRQRRLSMSSLVVDLALLFKKKLSLEDD